MTEPTTGNTRGQRTRRALLDAGRDLLEERGFEGLTMAATAERAGVSRRAIYLHVSSRAELVSAIHNHIAEQEGRTESLQQVWAKTDPADALDEWASHLARYHTRILAVDRALRAAQFADPDAAEYRAAVTRLQRSGCRWLIQGLADVDRLAPDWDVDSAADMLWSLLSTDMMEALLSECDWSQEALRTRLQHLFRSVFVAGDPNGHSTKSCACNHSN